MGSYKHSINRNGRRGTAAMKGGVSGQHAGGWWLVPSYSNKYGGQDYDWNNAIDIKYPTKKAALTAKKQMRSEGKLP